MKAQAIHHRHDSLSFRCAHRFVGVWERPSSELRLQLASGGSGDGPNSASLLSLCLPLLCFSSCISSCNIYSFFFSLTCLSSCNNASFSRMFLTVSSSSSLGSSFLAAHGAAVTGPGHVHIDGGPFLQNQFSSSLPWAYPTLRSPCGLRPSL